MSIKVDYQPKSSIMRNMSFLKRLLLLSTAIFMTSQLFGTNSGVDEGEWTLLIEEKGIQAFVKSQKCEADEIFVFKLKNLSQAEHTFSYTIEAVLDPSFPPLTNVVTLAPGAEIIGDCSSMWELALPSLMGEKVSVKEMVTVKLNDNPKPNNHEKIITFLLTVIFGFNLNAQDSQGTDFWIACPGNLPTVGIPELYITAQANSTVTIDIPGLTFNQVVNITAGNLSTVALPVTSHIQASGISNLGIHVTATTDVTVYLMNARTASTDAYMALPIDALGTDYYVMGYSPDLSFSIPAQLTIVATENNTTVTINPTAPNTESLTVGANNNIVLQAGQTYQIRSSVFTTAGDFTGSKVTSDKPIAVFGGNQCTNISGSLRACDYLVEQLPPTTAWGKSFVTVPLATRTAGDVFRVLALQSGTNVMVNGSSVATLNAGEFYETILASTSYNRITSNNPILVGQFSRSSNADGVVSDPFFALVPPDDQFLVNYIISSGTSNIPNNYLNITSPNGNTGSVLVDGNPVGGWSAIGATGFSGTRVSVGTGVHSVTSVLPIGVLAYGFGSFDSYGYLGGQSFSPVATVSSMDLNIQQINAFQAQEICGLATVLDQNNIAVPGVLVQISLTAGSANAGQAAFGITNALGQVNLCYHACYAGLDTVIASIAGITDTIFVNVAPSDLSLSPNSVNANAGTQTCVTAMIVDGVNTPVPNALVNFEVFGANPGAIVPVNTNGAGQATFCYTPGISGIDTIVASAACTDGDKDTTIVNVTTGGVPCPPVNISLQPYGLKAFWGLPDPFTFYFGISQWKRIRATVSGGVGPFTYTWGKVGTGQLFPFKSPNQHYLFEPMGPVKVYVDVLDVGTNCTYSDTVSIAWNNQYFCGTINPPHVSYYLWICQSGTTMCLPWKQAKDAVKAGLATMGQCPVPKTNIAKPNGVSIYPNPTQGQFIVEHVADFAGDGSIDVFDVNGRIVYSTSIQIINGQTYNDVDISPLANGIYIIRVTDKQNVHTEKIQLAR